MSAADGADPTGSERPTPEEIRKKLADMPLPPDIQKALEQARAAMVSNLIRDFDESMEPFVLGVKTMLVMMSEMEAKLNRPNRRQRRQAARKEEGRKKAKS